jgi:hypothetical protein
MEDAASPTRSASSLPPGIEKWVWKLFTGDAYPYITRTIKHRTGLAPTETELREQFTEVYTHSTVKIMVMELVGAILEFQDLAVHPYGSAEFSALMADPIGSLSRTYGGGKFKLSFYYGDQFVATQNFKVAGLPKWNMNKCLTSLIHSMVRQDQATPSPASTWEQLIGNLFTRHRITAPSGTMEKSQLLQLIRLTAGNQYEDYFSLLLNGPDHQPVVDALLLRLKALYHS